MNSRLEGLQVQTDQDLVERGVSDLQEDALSASRGVWPYTPTRDLWQELEAVEETVDDAKSYTNQ